MCVIMIKRILYLILLCLTAPVVQAQQHSFFTHYSTEDGLSQNTVMSMLQDHKDNLWFATWDESIVLMAITLKLIKHGRET